MSAIADVVINRLNVARPTHAEPTPVSPLHQVELDSPRHLTGARIVFVNRYYYPDLSATSQMLTDLARRLVSQGAQVHVVCCRQLYGDASANLPAEEIIDGVQVHRVSTTCFGRNRLAGRAFDYLSFYVSATGKLLSLVRRHDVLVAKTDPPMISLVAATVARIRGARLVNWLQDLFPEVASHLGKRLPGPLERLLLWLRDASLKCADANVAIGSRMKSKLLERGIPENHIHVVGNWSDEQGIVPMPSSSSVVRAALGLQNKFVVGYSGNLGRAHEFDTLLCAARALRRENDVVFLMTGGGVKMSQLKKVVAEEQLPNFVFAPYQPRELLSDSLAAADLHLISLLPQLEGLIVPSKLYGILAAGRPCIMIGDVNGEVATVTSHEQCGESVQVGDWDSLVSVIWRMKMEPHYRRQMGVRARAAFLKKFTVEQAVQRWIQVLMGVRSRNPSANSTHKLAQRKRWARA